MQSGRPLSSLELTALGIILKRGPCNAHAVVREFAGSQTFAYRSGAGAVYPLLKRLTEAGLLVCERKLYTLTEGGLDALKDWLRPPFPPGDISTNLDVIRSRAYFLKILSPDERTRFVDHCLGSLRELLKQCELSRDGYRIAGDAFSEIAMVGAIRETEARIDWISQLGEHVAELP